MNVQLSNEQNLILLGKKEVIIEAQSIEILKLKNIIAEQFEEIKILKGLEDEAAFNKTNLNKLEDMEK